MQDDITGTLGLDALAGRYGGISTKTLWDKTITQGPGINAGPANKRTYELSRGTVRKYFDYLKRHGISYSRNFIKKKKKQKKPAFMYWKDKIDPDNLRILK